MLMLLVASAAVDADVDAEAATTEHATIDEQYSYTRDVKYIYTIHTLPFEPNRAIHSIAAHTCHKIEYVKALMIEKSGKNN